MVSVYSRLKQSKIGDLIVHDSVVLNKMEFMIYLPEWWFWFTGLCDKIHSFCFHISETK
jgi:hypothetical protein